MQVSASRTTQWQHINTDHIGILNERNSFNELTKNIDSSNLMITAIFRESKLIVKTNLRDGFKKLYGN